MYFGFVREAVTNAIRDTLLPKSSSYSTYSLEKTTKKERVGYKAKLGKIEAKYYDETSPVEFNELEIEPKYKEVEVWLLKETIHQTTYKPLVDKREKSSSELPPQIFIDPSPEEKRILTKIIKEQETK